MVVAYQAKGQGKSGRNVAFSLFLDMYKAVVRAVKFLCLFLWLFVAKQKLRLSS